MYFFNTVIFLADDSLQREQQHLQRVADAAVAAVKLMESKKATDNPSSNITLSHLNLVKTLPAQVNKKQPVATQCKADKRKVIKVKSNVPIKQFLNKNKTSTSNSTGTSFDGIATDPGSIEILTAPSKLNIASLDSSNVNDFITREYLESNSKLNSSNNITSQNCSPISTHDHQTSLIGISSICSLENEINLEVSAAQKLHDRVAKLTEYYTEKLEFLQKKVDSLEGINSNLVKANRNIMRQNSRLKKEKQAMEKSFKTIFNDDQLRALGSKSTRGWNWSDDTIKNALLLKFSCGINGYEELLKMHYPLPSLRTLQRRVSFAVHADIEAKKAATALQAETESRRNILHLGSPTESVDKSASRTEPKLVNEESLSNKQINTYKNEHSSFMLDYESSHKRYDNCNSNIEPISTDHLERCSLEEPIKYKDFLESSPIELPLDNSLLSTRDGIEDIVCDLENVGSSENNSNNDASYSSKILNNKSDHEPLIGSNDEQFKDLIPESFPKESESKITSPIEEFSFLDDSTLKIISDQLSSDAPKNEIQKQDLGNNDLDEEPKNVTLLDQSNICDNMNSPRESLRASSQVLNSYSTVDKVLTELPNKDRGSLKNYYSDITKRLDISPCHSIHGDSRNVCSSTLLYSLNLASTTGIAQQNGSDIYFQTMDVPSSITHYDSRSLDIDLFNSVMSMDMQPSSSAISQIDAPMPAARPECSFIQNSKSLPTLSIDSTITEQDASSSTCALSNIGSQYIASQNSDDENSLQSNYSNALMSDNFSNLFLPSSDLCDSQYPDST